LTSSVTHDENLLIEKILWKAETVFFESEAGNKEIILQLSLILCMPIIQAGY